MSKLRLHHASSTFGAIAGSSHHFVWRLLANPHTRVTLRCPWTHLFGPHPARRGLVFQLPLIKEWMHRNVFERLMLDYTKKTLDGKTFGSASQEFIDIRLNYIKHLDWWLVTYFLRRKNSSVPAWIENNQNLNARCPVESCHAWFHVFHLSVRSLSKSIQSLSLSLYISTLMVIYSNHPSVRPFESTTGPPFCHSSGDFTTPISQCELSSLIHVWSSPWKPNRHDLYANVPFDTHVPRYIYIYIYIYIHTVHGCRFPTYRDNACIDV